MLENKLAFRIACIATLLAFIVILLGATTRLKDAGLGCPDWPGCYGKAIVPHQLTSTIFANHTINQNKAWIEMVHRYAAATLILLCFATFILILHKRKLPHQPVKTAFLLLVLLFLQGLLGKWTVTLQLHPIIVLSHLLGGISLLSLLWILLLRLSPFLRTSHDCKEKKTRYWAIISLIIVLIQIMLGGWTSSNYAAFICPDFPRCQGQWWPTMNFSEAFHLWLNANKNFEGGLLSSNARTAIQIVHRIGAIITTASIIFLSYKLKKLNAHKTLQIISNLLIICLALQITFGILNVIWLLPLPVAIAHNGVAVCLLLLLITLNYFLNSEYFIKII
ncbi:MAG: COX15/CtaA family protein [Rickettsiella sp.]|nr:COX15/CtaA family protein [Rickettsiella sp.]